jgi:rhamnosyltransferase
MVPRICVLLATYNGAMWLETLVRSVQAQVGVSVVIVVRDDESSDNTLKVLTALSAEFQNMHVLVDSHGRLGSANRNFMAIVRGCPSDILASCEYVAFCDQDDVWLDTKLYRAVSALMVHNVGGYSSSVTAFWPNGARREINKAAGQTCVDYLFGSPGPGCTFLLRREDYLEFSRWVACNYVVVSNFWVHDWLIYAWFRSRGLRWVIDPVSSLLYRQHNFNEIGANSGFHAAFSRYKMFRDGSYRKSIVDLVAILGVQGAVSNCVVDWKVRDRVRLIFRAFRLRRDWRDGFAMILFALVSK